MTSGVERALHQPVHSAGFSGDALRFIVEDGDELRADALALGFRVGNTGKLLEETLAGVDGDDVEAELVAQVLLHILEFVFAQHAVVYEDAGELAANGFVHQHCCDRRIDPAGETANHVPLADFFADCRDGSFDEVSGSPVTLCAADVEDEVPDELRAERGVVDFGMKLHSPDAAIFVGDSGERVEVTAVRRNPGGNSRASSPWLIQT